MRGINGKGNVQKSFITNLELWNKVATKAQADGVSISDVLRQGMLDYLSGKLVVVQTWQKRKGRRADNKN